MTLYLGGHMSDTKHDTYPWFIPRSTNGMTLLIYWGELGVQKYMGILKSYHRNHAQELIRLHQTWKGYNSLSWVTQRVGHLALRWRWPQQSITWPSSACIKVWTGGELLTVPEASGLALVPTVGMTLLKLPPPCPPVHRLELRLIHLRGPRPALPFTWSLKFNSDLARWLSSQQLASSYSSGPGLCALPPLHWVHFMFLSDSSSALSGLLSHSITYIHSYWYPEILSMLLQCDV